MHLPFAGYVYSMAKKTRFCWLYLATAYLGVLLLFATRGSLWTGSFYIELRIYSVARFSESRRVTFVAPRLQERCYITVGPV